MNGSNKSLGHRDLVFRLNCLQGEKGIGYLRNRDDEKNWKRDTSLI